MDPKPIKEALSVYGDLSNTLYKHNAIISGSYVLHKYIPEKNNNTFDPQDIDVYINARNLNSFLEELINNTTYDFSMYYSNYHHNYTSSPILTQEYDKSFFYKNGIKFKIRGELDTVERENNWSLIKLDIIVVNDDRKLTDVVTNFDLTFCEIWYDGRKVKASDPKGIKHMKGHLRNEYINSYIIDKNMFIQNRIDKYIDRGFTILINPKTPLELKTKNKTSKIKDPTKEKLEKWLVIKLIHMFLTDFIDETTQPIFYDFLTDFRAGSKGYITVLPKNSLGYYEITKQEYQLEHTLRVIYSFVSAFKKYTFTELDYNLQLYFGFTNEKFMIYAKKLLGYLKNKDNNEIYVNITNEFIKRTTKQKSKFNSILSYIRIYYNFIPQRKISTIDIGQGANITNGYDPIEREEVSVNDHIRGKDNIAIVDITNGNDRMNISLFNLEYILFLIKDMNDNWFYECEKANFSNVYRNTPYIKLSTMSGNIYIYYEYLFDLYKKVEAGNKVFVIKKEKTIKYSASHKNVYDTEYADYIGANHCQEGSVLHVYDLYVASSNSNSSNSKNISKTNKNNHKEKAKSTSLSNKVNKSKRSSKQANSV